MRMFLGLLALFASLSAWALPIYNCDVTTVEKNGWKEPWTKKLVLSPAFTNRVDFNRTTLDLYVAASGVILGEVNGQPNFMLSGDVQKAKFESAYHTGTITCSPEVDVPFVMKFIPWKQYFTVDPILSQGHIHHSVELSQVEYGLLCFVGDVNETNAAISQNFGVTGKIINPYRIDFTWEADDCIRWQGNNPDDFECLQYQRNKRTKSVMDCNGEPDPRS